MDNLNCDVLSVILSPENVTTDRDYYAVNLVCGRWHNVMKEYIYMNAISTFITQNIDLDWDFDSISDNLSLNAIETIVTKLNISHIPNIERNPRLSIQFIDKYIDRFNNEISQYSPHYEHIIIMYPHLISYNQISRNNFLSSEFIIDNLDKLDHDQLLDKKGVDMDILRMLKCGASTTNYRVILRNPTIAYDFIIDNLRKLDYDMISDCEYLTPAFIRAYDNNLIWYNLSQNRALTMPLICEYIERVDWLMLSYNVNLTMDFVYTHLEKLDINALCSNSSMSEEFIEKHIDRVQLRDIIDNENLTCDFWRRNMDILKGELIDDDSEESGCADDLEFF